MDEEELNKAPAAPEPEAPTEPTEEPITEQAEAEAQVDKPVAKEPVEEPTVEEQIEDQPAEETPAEPVKDPNSEPNVEEPAEPEPGTEKPATPAEAPEEPAEPTNPDLVASAEAETPAEQAPVFPTDANQNQKSKKPLIIAMVVFLVLALGGTGIWYFLLRDKGTTPETSVQNDVEPAPDLEPIPANKLALRDNNLSDFDLAFLRLENKQDNIIYSPLSIKYALAMLADGANGRSKEQITAVIGDYQPKAYLNSANRSLANGMLIRTDFSENVKPTYIDTLKNKYYAEVVYDPFESPDNANKWVEDKTLGIIKNTFSEDDVSDETAFILINALAIDMNWKYRIECASSETWQTDKVSNMEYGVRYAHEKYYDSVGCVMDKFPTFTFNGQENTEAAKIGTSANRYDIIKELGEEYIRNTVRPEYEKYLNESIASWQETLAGNDATDWQKEELPKSIAEAQASLADIDGTYLDKYIEALSANYGKLANSTDFYFLDNESEKVFAKDLQEYDGSTLQYVGIMPKSGSLNAYLNNLTAEKASALIAELKDPSKLESFKEGVVTKITGYIPFFKYSFTMDNFMENLESLGITDVFSTEDADLSNMIKFDTSLPNKPFIDTAIHKADIEFTNDGIKAAAVTAFGGKGAGGDGFDYEWDVPVEEIDLTFDKPFLFLIRDKSTGEVWFTGTVYNPSV